MYHYYKFYNKLKTKLKNYLINLQTHFLLPKCSLCLFLFLLILLNSCNDNPTTLGFPLDTLEIESISTSEAELITNSENSIARLKILHQQSYFHIGKYNDLTAIAFLRYRFVPDSLTYVNESNIVSAKLFLRAERYGLGDTLNGNLGFDLYELKEGMDTSTTWESVYPDGVGGGTTNSKYFIPNKIGSFDGKITKKDTNDKIGIDIDKNFIVKWLRFSESRDTNVYSYSFGIIPNENSKLISSFGTRNDTYKNDAGFPIIEVVYTNKNNKLDTLKLARAVVHTITNVAKPSDDNKIIVQGGVAIRSQLSFDLSEIPQKSSIVKAQLELHLIPEETYHGNNVFDSTLVAGENWIGAKIYNTPFAALKETGTNKYVFPSISSAVQKWNQTDGKGSLVFYTNRNANDFEESRNFDRYVFHGTKSVDITKRPKLTIFFTRRPN